MDIIIETPKGSNLKYVWDKALRLFRIKKKLAEGLVFPFDFGFIPGTRGEDGGPLDIMVIAEFSTFPGCVMDCRVIGCIQAVQSTGNKKIRNDRYLAISEHSESFKKVNSIEQLPPQILTDIEQFLINYISAEGKEISLSGTLSARQALESLKASSG
jgi:inorganic pyrophosphatase